MISYSIEEWDQVWDQAIYKIMKRDTISHRQASLILYKNIKSKMFWNVRTERYTVKDSHSKVKFLIEE